MTGPRLTLTALSLMLVPMAVSAQPDPTSQQPHVTRRLLLRSEPTDAALDIYVAKDEATIISLPLNLHTRGTGILGGGKGRFNVLKGEDQILVTPKRGLANGERIPMFVTLADGTFIGLSLTSAPEGHRTDGLVEISKEPDELQAPSQSMPESVDEALAELLVGGHAGLTTFIRVKERTFVTRSGRKIALETYALPPDPSRVTNEVGAVFTLTNQGTAPLVFSVARAFRSQDPFPVPLAFRLRPRVIPPGGQGQLAVVLDQDSFELSDGKLAIDFFSKARGGQCEFSVDLSIGDFQEGESWWRAF